MSNRVWDVRTYSDSKSKRPPKRMSDAPQGTPLEDIEMGNVKNEADAATMRELMADIDGGADQNGEFPTGGREEFPTQVPQTRMPMPSMPAMMPMRGVNVPPMQPHPSQQLYGQEEYEEEEQPRPKYKVSAPAVPKRNIWSSAIETIRDPLIVGILIFVLSLPSLHTFVGRHASWAYKVGGQLSWVGLGITALVGALAFGLYRAVLDTITK
jgi:hypothetical protein